MRKRYILLLLFLILRSAASIAQQNKTIDSLLEVLEKQKDDTGKVKMLLKEMADSCLQVGKTYSSDGNNSDAMKNYFFALKLIKEIGNKQDIADCYFQIGMGYAGNDLPQALEFLFSALKIYREISDHNQTYQLYIAIARIYSWQGNYSEALKYYLAHLKHAEQFGTKTRIAAANKLLGHFYNDQSNYPQALKYFLAYHKISKESGDKTSGPDIVMGLMHFEQGNYPEALKYYLAALKISEETGDENQITSLYGYIALIYLKEMRFPEALKYYGLKLKLEETVGEKTIISLTLQRIGDTYVRWAQQIKKPDSLKFRELLFSEALKNYRAALIISEKEENKMGVSLSYAAIANTYHLQKNFSEALNNYFAAIKPRKALGQKGSIISYTLSIGEIYIELNKFSEARKFLNEALSVSMGLGNKIYIKDSYEHLTALDIASGNWEGAYQNYRMFIIYRDSLVNKENTETILRQQIQYDFEKKEDSLKYQQSLTDEKLKQQILLAQQQEQVLLLNEKEIALIENERRLFNNEKQLILNEKQLNKLQFEKSLADYAVQKTEAAKKQEQLTVLNKEKEIQSLELKKQKLAKNYFIAGLILFAIISVFIYRNHRTRQQLRLQTLRNKIASDLHDDIGSTLSSISIFSQMAQQQSKDVVPLLETIGENSRKMLDAMADIVWTINPENDQFEKIVLRMRSFAFELLGAKNIDFEFIADEDVTKMKLSMDVRKNLYLIFKEATNNMVKYSGADKAVFAIRGEKNNLILSIRDNGKGFDQLRFVTGNGLKNMRKRAEEIGATFVIDSKPGNGTTIELKLAI